MCVCIELNNFWKKVYGFGFKTLAPERLYGFPLELNHSAVLLLPFVQPLPLFQPKLYGAVNVENFLHLGVHDWSKVLYTCTDCREKRRRISDKISLSIASMHMCNNPMMSHFYSVPSGLPSGVKLLERDVDHSLLFGAEPLLYVHSSSCFHGMTLAYVIFTYSRNAKSWLSFLGHIRKFNRRWSLSIFRKKLLYNYSLHF